MKTRYIIVVVIAIFTIIFHLAASAGGREHEHHDHQTINNIYKDDNGDNWKYAVGGAIVTCAAISIWRQKWCWEPDKKVPLPDPGPALKITPNVPTGVRLYQ